MPDNTIYRALHRCMDGTTLTLPRDTFVGGISEVLGEYFPPDGTLVIEDVHLVQQGEEVTFNEARGSNGPLKGAVVHASFTPAPARPGASTVALVLTAVLPEGWRFSSAWPLLANGPTDQLSVSDATLTLSSLQTTGPAGLVKGLAFDGEVHFPAAWSAALWLLKGAAGLHVGGAIRQRGTAPSFDFSTPVGKVDLPVLGKLDVAFAFTSETVPGSPQPPGQLTIRSAARPGRGATAEPNKDSDGPVESPWVPRTALGVRATIIIAQAPVPILVDLSAPSATLPVTADVSALSVVMLQDLAQVLAGADLGAALPDKSVFDPGEYLTVKSLAVTLNPAARKLVSAELTLGTRATWPITAGLSCGPVDLTFLIEFAEGTVRAALAGGVHFTGGTLGLAASYPGFVFSGGLTPGSTIELSSLLKPILRDTPIRPSLTLDELDFVVQPLDGGSFSLVTGLIGDWSVPVGPARLTLTRAYLALARRKDGTSGSGTSGSIAVKGELTPPAGAGQPITIDGSWTLPGSFSLHGEFPDLDLTALAAKLSGVSPPAGVPDIDLRDGTYAIMLDVSTGDASFALAAAASIDDHHLGSGMFVVRRTPQGVGFLVGFVVDEGWSPAQIWPELDVIFNNLPITKAGLLISTLPTGSPVNLPTMKMPSLPASVSPGFSFFSTLDLTRGILSPLSALFSDDTTLDLLAVVDTGRPTESVFKATFTGSSVNQEITWNDVVVTIKPATTTFTVRAGATFEIEQEKLTLSGEGRVTMEPPSASFSLLLEDWRQPFGIEGLVVKQFGLQVGCEGGGVTIGLLGAFVIGTGQRTFTLVVGGEIIDFEAPGALIFQLDDDHPDDPLMLSDVIKQFTSLELSSVPVLNAIAFRRLDFAVVDDPAGFTIGGYHFPPGIGIAADVLVYDWEAKFNLQVEWGTGVLASGSINKPISIADVFVLSSADGQRGPSGSIDTSQLPSRTDRPALARLPELRAIGAGPEPYFTLDGRLRFLGLDESIRASATGKTFDFDLAFSFLDAVTAELSCHLVDATNFRANGQVGFDLDVTVGPYAVGGVELVPRVHIDGPAATLRLGVQVDPSVIAQLSLCLSFTWGTLECKVDFTLSAADIQQELTRLAAAVLTWLKENVDKLFAEVLADVARWVEALKHEFQALAEDIDKVADALANYFKTAAEDAAAFLKRLGYGFAEIVAALVQFFKLAYDRAYALVESLWKDCAMENAQQQAYDPTTPEERHSLQDLSFALTESADGQRLLEAYYVHQEEIERLLAPHPYLHDRLSLMLGSRQGAIDLRPVADTAIRALVAIGPSATPTLRREIDTLIPLLVRYRDMSVSAVLHELEASR